MKKITRVALKVTLVLALLLGAAWLNRSALVLTAVGIAMDMGGSVGPNVAVEWQAGEPDAGAPGERPPNIVLILADDLGWNDLTFGGGGVAGGTVPTPRIDSIAAEGASFVNGYAANGTCAPSRAALTTKLSILRVKIWPTCLADATADLAEVVVLVEEEDHTT